MELTNVNNSYNDVKIIQNSQETYTDSRRVVSNDSIKPEKKVEMANESDIKRFETAINEINNKIKQTHTRFEFSYHEVTKRVAIKVLDKETNKVIREIPPEESLEMLEKLWEIAGLFVDESR